MTHTLERMFRFTRGMTPIRPQRPVYGWKFSCSCGLKVQVNGTKKEAIKSFKHHVSMHL